MTMTWKKEKKSSLSGQTVVIFSIEPGDHTVVASAQGIEGSMPMIEDEQELQAFARLVSEAWSEHRKLKPRLVTTPSGH